MKKKNATTPPADSAPNPNPNPNPIPVPRVEDSPRDFIWENFERIPGLPEITYFAYSDTKDALPIGEHRHPGSFKFNYIEKGQTSWEVDRLLFETKQGDLFVIRPDEFHRPANHIFEPCRMWSVGFRVPYVSAEGIGNNWMQQNDEDIVRLLDGLNRLPRVTAMGGHPIHAFRRLGRAVQQPGPQSRLEGRNAVIDLILQLLAASGIDRTEAVPMHYTIAKLIDRLDGRLGERLTVDELAKEAGVSVAYFHRQFLEYTGMTPRTYIERVRIREACRRLTDTALSVTTISADLGFATSQHFARVFHRITGATPTQWRRNNIDIATWASIYGNDRFDFIRLREPGAPTE